MQYKFIFGSFKAYDIIRCDPLSEDPAATFRCWRCRHVPEKHLHLSTELDTITSHKTVI